jgi:hypothetical protein
MNAADTGIGRSIETRKLLGVQFHAWLEDWARSAADSRLEIRLPGGGDRRDAALGSVARLINFDQVLRRHGYEAYSPKLVEGRRSPKLGA